MEYFGGFRKNIGGIIFAHNAQVGTNLMELV